MQVVEPITVTDAIITASNIVENDAPVYAGGTTYNLGDEVIYEHVVYESLVGSNLGNQPDISPVEWLALGATKLFKPFDTKISDELTNADSITYTFTPGTVIDTLIFFGLEANEVTVEVNDPTDGVVYSETVTGLTNEGVSDWYTYYFSPVAQYNTELVFSGLPPYSSASISITITNTGLTAKVGQITMGFSVSLGLTTYGSNISIQDYSRKDRDAFGNPIIVERAFARLVDFDVQLPTRDIRRVDRKLSSYRATPVVWIGVPEEEYGLVIYGYYRKFDILISNVAISEASIEVEGLI